MTRILVVEDEPAIALGLQDDLQLEGYDVSTARDGESCLTQARDGRFDLILLDVMLPRKDGFEVCRELRRNHVTTPIVMLTARTRDAEKILGLEIGADDYITKPFSPAELRARIKAVLRRARPDAPTVLRFGDVEADLTKFELRRAGKPVRVTPLELKLLAMLARHPGIALSRARLADLVWGPGKAMTDRVIDTHIANLRKKIEPDPSRPRYVVGVRGVGYRFDG